METACVLFSLHLNLNQLFEALIRFTDMHKYGADGLEILYKHECLWGPPEHSLCSNPSLSLCSYVRIRGGHTASGWQAGSLTMCLAVTVSVCRNVLMWVRGRETGGIGGCWLMERYFYFQFVLIYNFTFSHLVLLLPPLEVNDEHMHFTSLWCNRRLCIPTLVITLDCCWFGWGHVL